jgi:hypothetical protein
LEFASAGMGDDTGPACWYREMEVLGEMIQITDLNGLETHFDLWNNDAIPDETKPIGYILSLEGCRLPGGYLLPAKSL